MSLNTLPEIIQFAIDKEKNAQAFYRSAAGLSNIPESPLFLRNWPRRKPSMRRC